MKNKLVNLVVRLSKFSGVLAIVLILFLFLLVSMLTFLFMKPVDYAFEGAYGAGAYTLGGRSGNVYHVTTLEDSYNEGTLRHALTQKGARTIVFDVAGIIDLKSPLIVKNGLVTVAGQTAPGDGICIKGDSVIFQCNDVILRYLRFRFAPQGKDASLIIKNQNNIIIDHCSISWGKPSNLDFFDNTNSTLQWSIIGESLGKYGARIGGNDITVHHNYFVNNELGNPYFWQEKMNTLDDVVIDFRNNVLYNWGDQSVHGIHLGLYNLIDNYYKFGSATSSNSRFQIVNTGSAYIPSRVHVANNYVYLNPLNTNDNNMGVYPNITYLAESKNALISPRPFAHEPVYTHSPKKTLDKVMKYAGASLKRDKVDTLLIQTSLISDLDTTSYHNFAKDFPKYISSDIVATDLDNDGMPDFYEIENGFDARYPYDARKHNKSNPHFTNLEIYLNGLVDEITKAEYSGHRTNLSSYFLFMKSIVNKYKL